MATSETMSSPNEWMQFYQSNYFSDINQILPPPTAATSLASPRNSNLTPNRGRISKPLQRRTRASRRTPTTLFNTDAANFRSMVQRFTGAPVSPFAARSQPSRGSETFALHAMSEAATAVHAPTPAAGFHMQYAYPQQHQQVLPLNRTQGGGGEAVSSHLPPGFHTTEDHPDCYNYMV